ncbi:MAG TPA: pyridoxamine 5'-phosphate oxidase family protein [Nakamurella sp.]|jgi:hypothetical protein|nr:pyridoxamine 5'-phosphate oxidase family protein [Nakamurella sp.]
MRADSTGLWVLTDAECWRLLAGAPVGRVVVSMNAMPAALPVNYQLIGREIYFRTAAGTKMTAAVNRTVVAFQVDEFDSAGTSGWSVLVVGTARLVSDPDERALLDAAGIRSWVTDPAARYVAISVERITGRRLQHSRPDAAAVWSTAVPPSAVG